MLKSFFTEVNAHQYVLQVKKPKAKARVPKPPVAPVDRSPSLHKISPLQQYILEQAKLSGYRVTAEKRDSFIDSENESHRTGMSCMR